MLGEPFAAEWAGVCPALFLRQGMPCAPLRVRWYARLFGADLPPIKATLGGLCAGASFGSDYSVGEKAFQRLELEHAVSVF